jgi:hypothetical protein
VVRELKRVLDPQHGRSAVFTTPPGEGDAGRPYPPATLGRSTKDAELAQLPLVAGLAGAQLLVAR